MPEFDPAANAANLVCVSIGANLLLPVAPSIMSRFFKGIEIDGEKIVTENFNDVRKYVCEEDVAEIGTLASSVERRREDCTNDPGLAWRIIDVVFAVLGILILWSGWTKDETIAKWVCPFLFLPLVLAAGHPFLVFLSILIRLKWKIHTTRSHAIKKMKADRKKKALSDDKIRSTFIKTTMDALAK